MIRTIKIELNASHPQMPLEPVKVFAGSAASFTVLNVPRSIGERAVTGLSCVYKLKSGQEATSPAVRVGSAYVVTVPASALSEPYSATLGVRFVGTGTDENKATATWVLGVGDLYVLNSSGEVTPGSEAGDMSHSEFSSLDADTSTLAEVITLLKGTSNA